MNSPLNVKSGSKTTIYEAVRYSKQLSSTEKILFFEIANLYKKQKKCWATNSHFANKFDLSERTISRCFSNLQKQGLIYMYSGKANGNKRLIFLCDESAKMAIPIDNNEDSYGQKKAKTEDSLLIYKKNNKINKELEGLTHQNLNPENLIYLANASSTPSPAAIENYMISLEEDWLKGQEKKEAQAFFDHYAARGWKMNGNSMFDWQAAVRSWLNKTTNFNKSKNENSGSNKSGGQWMGHINRLSSDRNKEYEDQL